MATTDEESKGQPAGAADAQAKDASTIDEAGAAAKETSASKEPVMGLDSNNNAN